MGGPWIRKDWLETIGLDVPQTYDDYEKVLSAIKNTYGTSQPIGLSGTVFASGSYLCGGYNCLPASDMLSNHGFYHVDGTVLYGAVQDEFQELLTRMHRWYELGLINSDYLSKDMMSGMNDFASGDIGIFYGGQEMMPSVLAMGQAIDENFTVTAIPDPVQNTGDKRHLADYNASRVTTSGAVAILACSEYPDLACQYIDFAFSEEGAMVANYGVEGETYYIDSDGSIKFTELVTDYSDSAPIMVALGIYVWYSGPFYQYSDKLDYMYDAAITDAQSVWTENIAVDDLWMFPDSFGLSADAEERFAEIYSDIATYCEESIDKFIVGDLSIEDDFETFRSNIYNMGLDKCIEIYQQAYDSANA